MAAGGKDRDEPRAARLDPAARKAVLRLFTYGLYGVTLHAGGVDHAFTANWLTQVSFDPPLVAVSVENDSRSITLLRASGVFAVNVFEAGARELAGRLGRRSRNVPDKLAGVPYRRGATGCPILLDALGVVECRVVGSLPAGDSTLFVGEVIAAELLREGRPLTMEEAGFRHSG
jgi:flavin reductase (DIM6/NTAB) family NADH-FMN oxidoreductase RutF